MKNFIKNNLKIFVAVIISGIVFTGVGVYAASQYFAKDISFTPTNENFKKENGELVDNVEDALNELYNAKKEKKLIWKNDKYGIESFSGKLLIDLSNYSYIAINSAYDGANIGDLTMSLIEVGKTGKIYSSGVYGTTVVYRTVNVTTDGIEFSNAYWSCGNSSCSDVWQAVPYEIYGIQ